MLEAAGPPAVCLIQAAGRGSAQGAGAAIAGVFSERFSGSFTGNVRRLLHVYPAHDDDQIQLLRQNSGSVENRGFPYAGAYPG